MWKNVFIESCILSALIFGGFYLNTHLLKSEISASRQNQNDHLQQYRWTHISGNAAAEPLQEVRNLPQHLSGEKTEVPHLSGNAQPPLTASR